MSGLMLFKMGFLVTISLLRLAVAVPLFQTARRNNLVNLYWLSAQFLALVIAVPFAAAGVWDNRWLFWTFLSFSEIALIMFIHTTFRRERSSLMPIFMTLAVIGLFGGAYGTLTNNFELSAWMVYPNAVLAWGWSLWESVRSYRNISGDLNTEDWIKSRYVMMIIYSGVDFTGAILGTLLTAGVWNSDMGSVIVVGINFTSVIFQILTWVMPEGFRRWLNRNQQVHTQERIRDQAQAVLQFLSMAMCMETGLQPMLTGHALRTAVGKSIGADDSSKMEAQASRLGYDEWLALLDDPEVKRLISPVVTRENADKAIRNAKQALADRQSLFTLQAK